MKKNTLILLLALALCCVPLLLHAVMTQMWEQSGTDAFFKGSLDEVSINADGEIVLGPTVTMISAITQNYIWDLAVAPNGTIYAASGSEGMIYKISGGATTTLYQITNSEVTAIAVGRDGSVYAASSPNGAVYKISAAGQAEILSMTSNLYIWDLNFDKDGKLIAATGPEGKIIRFPGGGRTNVLLDLEDEHIMCITPAQDGGYLLGTEGTGRVYYWKADGSVSVLYDAPQDEIHCIAQDSTGAIYAGTAAWSGRVTRREGTPPRHVPIIPDSAVWGEGSQNKVVKISKDGSVRTLMMEQDLIFLSLAVSGDSVFVGAGNQGEIYSIDRQGIVSRVFKADGEQVMTLAALPDGKIAFGTANLGEVGIIDKTPRQEGVYTSDILDTGRVSQWGNIRWFGRWDSPAQVTVSTRSGNADKPNNTWSDWSPYYTTASGSQIASPAARYLQYRVRLQRSASGASPVLSQVLTPYLPQNEPPVIASVTWTAPDPNDKKIKLLPYERSLQWEANDPDGDNLVYKLYFRRVQDEPWTLITDNISDMAVTLDARQLPDGYYSFKITASDEQDNPAERALSNSMASPVVTIDTHAPVVQNITATRTANGKVHIAATATDSFSTIRELSYSLDAQNWHLIDCADGVFDETTEEVSLDVPSLPNGFIMIQAIDYEFNIGSGYQRMN